MDFINLTVVYSLDVFANKAHVAPRLSLVNIATLNKVLQSEIFVSEDGQQRAIHLVLDFKPLLNAFQDVGQAIRVGDPRIHRIDVSRPSFLAQRDLQPVELPPQRSPWEVATLREETASSRFSLEVEIDQFHFEEEEGALERPIELSDSEAKLDRLFAAHSLILVTRVNNSSEEEEEMALNSRRDLKDLVAGRNKGSSSKKAPQT